MCDETTGLTRREFTAMGAAVLAAGGWSEAQAMDVGLTEAMIEVKTQDGSCEAFFVHPGSGKYPGVIFWPDAFGLRDVKKAMARRLASEGYAVLVVNQYYRNARLPLGLSMDMFGNDEGRAKMMGMMGQVTPEAVTRDAAAFVAFLDSQGAIDTSRGIGTQGYCMGGSLAVRTAAAVPARIRAVASLHGGSLVTDKADSPHRLLAATQSSYLFAIGKDDDAKAPTDKDMLRKAADAAGRQTEIEVYDANHSWCVPDLPAFDKAEAVRAYGRILALYSQL